jgi:hypothetical protein
MSQPLAPGEDARERADVLLLILGDDWLSTRRGSDGRQVDGAAAQALMALGHPYALELSPAHLEAMRAAERDRANPQTITVRRTLGLLFAIGLGLIDALVVTVLSKGFLPVLLLGWALVAATSFAPAIWLLSAQGVRNRGPHYGGLALVALPCLAWMVATSILLEAGEKPGSWFADLYVIPLALMVARVVTVFCLYCRSPNVEPASAVTE